MFVGTGSDVGKSVINTAFCRIFLQDGYSPAPFKAQNMSLNSFVTKEGLEIGRAQAVQAEACGLDCSVEMNPVLLKPTSYKVSQVVLHGKPVGNRSAFEYFNETDRDQLFGEAMSAYDKLAEAYNPIVIEGAGSISEINLWDRDITNMRVAMETNASVYLVADIDKGGVFASVYGTMQLLPEDQRNQVKGIIINKFRGDIKLFEDGKKILEDLTGKPIVGIIPYFRDIFIEQEDSVVVENKLGVVQKGKINIGIVLLKHMSNFTDFNILEQTSGVHLFYTADPDELDKVDIIIIPGSKNTISDTEYLRKSGLARVILEHHQNDRPVYGICGGFQIMGMEVRDPLNVEGQIETMPGLGILPIITTLNKEKRTEQVSFTFLDDKTESYGYEIHMGETVSENSNPLCHIKGKGNEGCFLNSKTWGTYIHGIFDNKNVIEYILHQIDSKVEVTLNYYDFKNENYDKLAGLVRNNVDMDVIYNSLV